MIADELPLRDVIVPVVWFALSVIWQAQGRATASGLAFLVFMLFAFVLWLRFDRAIAAAEAQDA